MYILNHLELYKVFVILKALGGYFDHFISVWFGLVNIKYLEIFLLFT